MRYPSSKANTVGLPAASLAKSVRSHQCDIVSYDSLDRIRNPVQGDCERGSLILRPGYSAWQL